MENLGREKACDGISDQVPTTSRLEEATRRQVICLEPTSRADGDDRSHASMTNDCQKTTGRLEEATNRPEEATGYQAIFLEPTGGSKGNDWSPVEFFDDLYSLREERDSDTGDSCADEINIRPQSTMSLPQSTCDNDEDALSDPQWVDAMHIEMEALNKNATWELVPLPKGKKAVRFI
ncbi:hypothetical protein L3X38_000433 [Prunus dulcis]|uniref:Uncharacterized protein n=1 Tax=Prunus dulcis TaxID=3755 RepID=A0AAD4WQN6_PRUDU|nr:hypothetical protein L3X38_000433 [Prunus dulcis]